MILIYRVSTKFVSNLKYPQPSNCAWQKQSVKRIRKLHMSSFNIFGKFIYYLFYLPSFFSVSWKWPFFCGRFEQRVVNDRYLGNAIKWFYFWTWKIRTNIKDTVFQQDCTSYNFALQVGQSLNERFPYRWIERSGLGLHDHQIWFHWIFFYGDMWKVMFNQLNLNI